MKMPNQWSAEKKPTQVNARLDMSAEVLGKGLCPECKNPMKRAMAGEIPVMVCAADRIALPLENDKDVE
jgi:hypothetical protein